MSLSFLDHLSRLRHVTRTVTSGTLLFERDDPVTSVYRIESGEVHLLRAEIVSLRRVSDRLDAWLAWNDNQLPDKGNWHQIAREIGVSPEALYRELARRRQSVASCQQHKQI